MTKQYAIYWATETEQGKRTIHKDFESAAKACQNINAKALNQLNAGGKQRTEFVDLVCLVRQDCNNE